MGLHGLLTGIALPLYIGGNRELRNLWCYYAKIYAHMAVLATGNLNINRFVRVDWTMFFAHLRFIGLHHRIFVLYLHQEMLLRVDIASGGGGHYVSPPLWVKKSKFTKVRKESNQSFVTIGKTAAFEPQPASGSSATFEQVFTSMDIATILDLLADQGHQPCVQHPTCRTRSLYLCPQQQLAQFYPKAPGSLFVTFYDSKRAKVEVC
jgi:hypothetical protein